MKNASNTLVSATVSFLVALAFGTLIEIFKQDHGSVMIGPTITIHSQLFVPIDISNYLENSVDDLKLSIPNTAPLKDIISSNPIQIKETTDVVGTNKRKWLMISGIEPNKVTRLLIPIAANNELEFCSIVNAKEKKIDVESIVDIRSPLTVALKDALPFAIILAIFNAIVTFWANKKMTEQKKVFEELKTDLQNVDKSHKIENSKLEEKANELELKNTRIRILLLARLTDYSKELNFWRDTIRKLLYQSAGSRIDSEKIITHVTETLKTYGTKKGSLMEFEAIKVMAGLLSNSSQASDNENDS